MAFVRRPRNVESIDGIILYEDKTLDAASKRPYTDNLLAGLPSASVLLLVAWQYSETRIHFFRDLPVYFGLLGIGIFWVLVEYVFHRFLLHRELQLDPDGPADGDKLARIFSQHLHHHVFMNQWYRTTIRVKAVSPYVVAIFVLLKCLLPFTQSCMTLAGVIVGSLLYDGMHLAFHHGPDINLWWFQKMKAAHMRHHFRDNSCEFGVTSPLFDGVLGTLRSSVCKRG